jgi:hypothetical protein
MALATNLAVMRSSGGDQTKTAYPGSIPMVAPFYIADASVATATNVKTSSAAGAPALILPAGAVVLSFAITDAGAGSVDIGTRGYTSGTVVGAAIANGLDVSAIATIGVGATVTGTAISAMSYVTVTIDTSGAGTVGGYITYFVPSNGQYA